MLHEEPRGRRPSICLVPSDLNYLYRNGGIGSYFWHIAHLLASKHWRVHILYGGPVEDRQVLADMPRRLGRAGIQFTYLDHAEAPAAHQVSPYRPAWYAQLSDRIRHALADLERVHHFDLIEFGDLNAYGFRTVQAKRAGGAFADTRLMVKLHGTSQWLRDGNYLPMQQADELRLDYCERYAFEHADVQLSPCQYMLDYVRSTGWNVRTDAQVVPYAFPAARFSSRAMRDDVALEIVFFGRLETRKGLEIFVEAARQLEPSTPITFLGRDTVLGNGIAASEWIRIQLGGRPVKLLMEMNQEQALTYLLEGNRVAVISSLADNFPNTVIECAVNSIPFVAARVGGIPEILWDPRLQDQLLFIPTAPELLRCLRNYLRTPTEQRQDWRDQAHSVTDVENNHERVAEFYQHLVGQQPNDHGYSLPDALAPSRTFTPRVSVVVTRGATDNALPAALTSLAAQTHPNMEVIVVEDDATPAGDEGRGQQAAYPQFHFVKSTSAGTSAARQCGLTQASGEYLITLESDNVCAPGMVERLVAALCAKPELAALGCYVLGIQDVNDIGRQRFGSAFRPSGGPSVLAALENVYGDVAIFRTEELRALGGFANNGDAGTCPWDTFVKLAGLGRAVDTLPEYLCFCVGRDPALSAEQNRANRRSVAPFAGADSLPTAERIGLLELLLGTHRRCEERDRQLAHLQAAHHGMNHQLQQLSQGNHGLDQHVHLLRVHAENLQHHLANYQNQVAQLAHTNEGLSGRLTAVRYRVADKVNRQMKRVPLVQQTAKRSLYVAWLAWKGVKTARQLTPAKLVRKLLGPQRTSGGGSV